jgi:hypothetical protein
MHHRRTADDTLVQHFTQKHFVLCCLFLTLNVHTIHVNFALLPTLVTSLFTRGAQHSNSTIDTFNSSFQSLVSSQIFSICFLLFFSRLSWRWNMFSFRSADRRYRATNQVAANQAQAFYAQIVHTTIEDIYRGTIRSLSYCDFVLSDILVCVCICTFHTMCMMFVCHRHIYFWETHHTTFLRHTHTHIFLENWKDIPTFRFQNFYFLAFFNVSPVLSRFLLETCCEHSPSKIHNFDVFGFQLISNLSSSQVRSIFTFVHISKFTNTNTKTTTRLGKSNSILPYVTPLFYETLSFSHIEF